MNVRVIAPKTAAETTLAQQFAALSADADRARAFANFAATGLPTRRNEAWHYTDLRAAMESAAPIAPKPDTARIEAALKWLATRKRLGDVRLVLVDGLYIEELSDVAPTDLTVAVRTRSLKLPSPDAVVALNDAFVESRLSVLVDEGVKLAPRVELAHFAGSGDPQAIYTSVAIKLRDGAEARIVESFAGAASDCQRHTVTRLSLGDGARCEHASVIDDDAGLHLESQIADLGADAQFNAFALVTGGALVRRQIFATLSGESASIKLGGLSLLDGARHADTTLVVDHAEPHGVSREFYKHIVADKAVGVYQGKVIVQPGAQKTDGSMKSQALLLSPHAIMYNKPELEIFADDVVCGHGATVGALDPEQMFYLQARGLQKAEAEAMLLEAFGAEAIERFVNGDLANLLRDQMRTWLARRGKA